MAEGRAEERTQAIFELYNDFYQKRLDNISCLKRTYGIRDNDSVFDLLGRSVYQCYAHLNTSFEILFLYNALSFIHNNSDCSQFTRIFLQYLRIKNEYFNNKMQSARIKGLRFFQDFFNKAAGAPYVNTYGGNSKAEAIYLSIFKDQGKCPNLKKMELKISPVYPVQIVSAAKPDRFKINEIKRAISKQISEIFRAYLKYFTEVCSRYSSETSEILSLGSEKHQNNCLDHYLDELQERHFVSFPTIGMVYHFIKTDDMDRYLGDICWVSPQNIAVLSSTNTLTLRKRYMEFWDALNEMIRDIPHLGDYIVGIDAASNELNAEPWIFAPVYRYVRKKENTYPLQLKSGQHIQNIGLTYHVGEDYRHVLSGLRYIDEVLTHFGFKAGDRIGHALALQVDIRSWVVNNEVVAMPAMEYLENLLWLWDLNSRCSEIKSSTSLDLEKKIMDTAKKLYDNLAGLSPYTLWKGYTQKFELIDNDKIEDMKKYYQLEQTDPNYCLNQRQGQPVNRCFCKLYMERQLSNGFLDPIWNEDKLLLTHFCPVYAQHYSRPIFVRTSQDDIGLLLKVQEYLKMKIQQAGIYVETNPTSNATIGDINSLFEHPLTNINSKDLSSNNNKVLLSINSDDPLIFNTNVENEIANVYHMLTNHAYSREDVLAWIDKVRQYGIDSSFIKHVKKPSVQRKELKRIVDYLIADVHLHC
jgi:Adenosine deaminase